MENVAVKPHRVLKICLFGVKLGWKHDCALIGHNVGM